MTANHDLSQSWLLLYVAGHLNQQQSFDQTSIPQGSVFITSLLWQQQKAVERPYLWPASSLWNGCSSATGTYCIPLAWTVCVAPTSAISHMAWHSHNSFAQGPFQDQQFVKPILLSQNNHIFVEDRLKTSCSDIFSSVNLKRSPWIASQTEAGFIHFRHIVLNITFFSLACDGWEAVGGMIGKGIFPKGLFITILKTVQKKSNSNDWCVI